MKKILLIVSLVGAFISCSKDENEDSLTTKNNRSDKSITIKAEEVLPIKIVKTEYDGYTNILESTTSEISYNGKKITKISDTNASYYKGIAGPPSTIVTTYEYNGDYISKTALRSDNPRIPYFDNKFFYSNKNKIDSFKTTGNFYGEQYIASSYFEWFNDNHVKFTYTLPRRSSNPIINMYYENGNTIKTVYEETISMSIYPTINYSQYSFTYDDKRSPFSNVIGIKGLIDPTVDMTILIKRSNNNNILTESWSHYDQDEVESPYESTGKYEYEYNSLNFPTKETKYNKDNNIISVTEYFYND